MGGLARAVPDRAGPDWAGLDLAGPCWAKLAWPGLARNGHALQMEQRQDSNARFQCEVPAGIGPIDAVAAGWVHTCALRPSHLSWWLVARAVPDRAGPDWAGLDLAREFRAARRRARWS